MGEPGNKGEDMSFDLSGYKTVDERIEEAKGQYPEGRFTTELLDLGPFSDRFVAVKARFYRTADDPTPAEGVAWEPVPGKTPYTKDSELMNAETSAWGRALVAALAVDTKKGIASANEVRNRQVEAESSVRCPDCGGATFDNTAENEKRVADGKKAMPVFKCRDRECGWVDWDGSSTVTRDDVAFDVAGWAASAVQIFAEWDDDRRRVEWKEAIGDLFGGEQPTGADAARQVIDAMSKVYYSEFPASDERPF